MAEQDKSRNVGNPGANAPGEISVERRMLLALVLMGAVLIGSQYLFRLVNPPAPEGSQETAAEAPGPGAQPGAPGAQPGATATPAGESSAGNDAPAPETRGAEPAISAAPAAVQAESEQKYVIETDLVKVVFSNRGAVVESWQLKGYQNAKGEPLEVVNQAAFAKTGKPFSLVLRGVDAKLDANDALYVATLSEDNHRISFEYSRDGWRFRKEFFFPTDSYRATFESEVTQGGVPVGHLVTWRGGFGDPTVDKRYDTQQAAFYDSPRGKLETRTAGDAEDAPLVLPGAYTYAGVVDKYFAAMFLPVESRSLDVEVYGDSVPYNGDQEEQNYVGVGVGGKGLQTYGLFVGPKNIDTLKQVNPKLADLVDFGWFFFIAEPLFLALNWLTDNYLHNFGWSIVVLTIAINFVMLPLKMTSMKSMKKMQALQPQIQAINDKYKGISIRDPKKQQQNQEIMELYQKNSVNPAAGCVPMLLQIPFFFAFYQVLSVAIELRGASWLWVSDLSRPEELAIRILPLTMVVSQIFMQRLTPTPSTDPTQKMMMTTMPLVFGFIFWWASSGLVLYWLTSNLVGIVQQLFINKFSASPAVEMVPAEKKPRRRK